MQNFEYYAPTKIIFGRDSELQTGKLLSDYGAKKVLIHYGGQSAKKSGLIDRVCKSLDSVHISYVQLAGVVPNPRLSKVYEGISLCKQENVDFILAVGGGSVIDSAKAIGYGITNSGDVWDFYTGKRVPSKCAPVGCILTIAAAGSEMSNSSVITNEDGWLKRGYRNDLCRCVFAVMNPALTATLDAYQTASGCTDIIMHTLERWFAADRTDSELTDEIAAGLIRTVMHNAQILKSAPADYAARAEIMWAGSLSHNDLTGCGGTGGDWAVHQLEHELGGMFDVTHGAGLAAVWGSWARYVCQVNPLRFEKLGSMLFGTQTVQECITRMEDFFRSIDMPVSIEEMDIHLSPEQIKELALKCSFFGQRTIGSLKKLDAADMEAVYKAAQ